MLHLGSKCYRVLLTSWYGTIALCHFHEHFVHVADVGLERIKTRRVCWHGDSDCCTVLLLTCNRGTRPCQVSVKLRHLSVNARSLKWDGMISWRENPASAPWEHKNTKHTSKYFQWSTTEWTCANEDTGCCALQQIFHFFLERFLAKKLKRQWLSCKCQTFSEDKGIVCQFFSCWVSGPLFPQKLGALSFWSAFQR